MMLPTGRRLCMALHPLALDIALSLMGSQQFSRSITTLGHASHAHSSKNLTSRFAMLLVVV